MQSVVAALAMRVTDGMDRREIQHVETHRAYRRQPRNDIVERAVARCAEHGWRCLRAREQLVPRGETGFRAFDVDRQGWPSAHVKAPLVDAQSGRASWRERVWQYV